MSPSFRQLGGTRVLAVSQACILNQPSEGLCGAAFTRSKAHDLTRENGKQIQARGNQVPGFQAWPHRRDTHQTLRLARRAHPVGECILLFRQS